MKHKLVSKNNGMSILMISALLLLPNCGFIDWFKDKFGGASEPTPEQMSGTQYNANDGSPVVATIDGRPLISKNMLESEKQRLIESNPQLQAMIGLMDQGQLDRNLADGISSREVIRKYIKDNNVEQSEKYKKDFAMVLNQVRDALNTRHFMEAFAEAATDAEIQTFYDENKESIPNLMISRGGVESRAVSFTDRAAAKEFVTKVKAAKNDIEKAAKDAGLTSRFKNLKLVNEETLGVDEDLKNKIVAIKSFPRVEVVKSGKEYWVVAATRKEDPSYRPLEQVRNELKQSIEKEKTMKRFEEEVARLKDEYKIQIEESFFADLSQDNAAAVQAQAEQTFVQEEAVAENTDATTRSSETTEQSAPAAETQRVAQTTRPADEARVETPTTKVA